jgi:hypothetical protein
VAAILLDQANDIATDANGTSYVAGAISNQQSASHGAVW